MKRDLTGLSKRLAGLSPEKRQMLEGLLRGERSGATAIPRREDPFAPQPLSFAQQRLWFLTEIDPDGYAYNIPAGFYIDGALDVHALERTINEIVRRHEVLRTRFDVIDGQPKQIVAPFAPRPLARLDLTELPPDEREREFHRFAADEAKRPFDLLAGAPIRTTLATLGPARFGLLFVFHHIVYDLWSIGVLVRELVALYEAFSADRPSTLPELSIQYADYARWQREHLAGDTLDQHLSYWREQLNGVAELELATDRPRAAVQTSRGGRTERLVPRRTADRVTALSRKEGVTPFMTLLAGFQALLHRHTRQDDIVVGTPTASRHPAEVESLIGFFVNSLVMRTSVAGDPTFRQLVGRVRTVALDAYAHQDAPFDKIVEALRPERTLSRNPLFQVMFTYQSAPPLTLEGLRVTPFSIETDAATVDFEVYAFDEPDGLRLVAHYNADLFDESTLAGLLRQFERFLDGATADPDRPISALPLLDDNERQQLLVDWNATPIAYPTDKCIQELFEQQVERRPEAVAVVYGDAAISYRELNQRANRLAHALRARGVTRDTLVGLMVERSIDMVVAMVAILKAGGAYVPLDTSYPADRLAFMLEDTSAPVVLTHTRLLDRVRAGAADAMCLDRDLPTSGNDENPSRIGTPDDRAYVIYTSGSTGRPKGVEVPHRAVARLVLGTNYVSLGPDARIAQASNAAFDAATFEVWGALLNGAQLVGVQKDVALSPTDFATELRSRRITTIFLTTALFNQMAREAPGGFATLEHVLFGGEAVDASCVRDVLANGRPRHLLHVYGPTENTTFSTWYPVDEVPAGATTVPIGGPIAATQLYVLDPDRQLVPVGTPGELYVGGDGLARGYLNRPELTSNAFVPNPFSSVPGARMYKTGDLVRWRSNGAIEFIGRIDQQVKIRGFRIEPGEVEAVVRECAGVRDAAVIVRELPIIGRCLVAYVVLENDRPEHLQEVRTYLKGRLPDYMVPSAWMRVSAIPLTPNGKVNRRALPEPELERAVDNDYVQPRTALEQDIVDIWRELLAIPQVGIDDNFFDVGGHSLLLVQVHRRLRALGHELSMVTLFTYPTVRRLAAHLSGDAAQSRDAAETEETNIAPDRAAADGDNAIAIIGMAGRFPGAATIEAFWDNLRKGRPGIRPFTDEELAAAELPDEIRRSPDYVNANGTLDDVAGFDAGLFGYTPREAQLLDPQQRMFLECAWEALERAGYGGPTSLRVGVYAGVGASGYSALVARAHGLLETVGTLQAFISNEKDFLTTRVSYKLNLTGPSVTVQTACSTSLVAVHLACRSLLGRECDVALAGGVKISIPQTGYVYQAGSIMSTDGHCRAFDAQASGTVGGNGAGVVVLKRLRDAIAAGDPIAAVIRGSAINNDGALKIGYTAPAVQGQAAVIAAAHADAKVDPESISYIEAHGTGTPLGDPIEIAALSEAFRSATTRTGFCPIGSVKTNVGHLDAAAGVTGLIKTVLALEHDEIPASLDFSAPNPAIDFASTPFFVAGAPTPWPRGGAPRRAGVSAFGIGGTNAHVVVEEAPETEPSGPSRPDQLLVLSARTPTALDAITDALADHLDRHPDQPLADVAYTLQVGRRRLEHRRFVVCADGRDAAEALRSREPVRVTTVASEADSAGVVFLFPGQGAQYVDMARGLYEQERIFRDEVDRCAEALRPHLGFDLRSVLVADGDRADAERRLAETAVTQPALFTVEYALAQLWRSWGVRPAAMLGHSIGEYVAACLAGVFSLEDALAIVAARGRLMQEQRRGAMMAVALPFDEVSSVLPQHIAIAAVNAPDAIVVAGPEADIDALRQTLEGRNVFCRVLPTSHAFHSPMMDGALARFRSVVAGVTRHAPAIPFVSNVSGTWITDDQAIDPEYWTSHLRSTVQFSRGVEAVSADPTRVLLEVGPGRSLTGLATRGRGAAAGRVAVASMRAADDGRSDSAVLAGALGRLWAHGVTMDWEKVVAGERRRRVLLPTYPFEHQRYWVDVSPAPHVAAVSPHVEDWLYQPSWKRVAIATRESVGATNWLLLDDGGDLGRELVRALRATGDSVITVSASGAFARESQNAFAVDPASARDLAAVVDALFSENRLPARVLSLWSVGGSAAASVDDQIARSYYGLLFLMQALGERGATDNVRVTVVTSDAQEVTGAEALCPANATAIGLARTIPIEYPGAASRAVDITMADGAATAARAIVDEVRSSASDQIVAWRGRFRWIPGYEPARLPLDPASRLRDRGVYLITGGLGGVGLEIARYLARTVGARLVLVGRTAVPSRDQWADIVGGTRADRRIRDIVRALMDIEAAGGAVLVRSADVSDAERMAAIVAEANAQWGAINGVIHAAGVPGGGVMQRQTRDAVERVFAAKIRGTGVLESIFADAPLDFVVLCSSLVSLVPLSGRSEYMAANLFVDAAARRWASRSAYPVTAINWDSWREVGMAVETARERFAAHEVEIGGMRSSDGIEAFARVLSGDLSQVIVSMAGLGDGDARELSQAPATAVASPVERPSSLHARPSLKTPFVAPRTDVERALAGIWTELLGIDPVGVEDNFFDLGGDSVVSIQIISRANRAGIRLTPKQVFEHQTIAELAAIAASGPSVTRAAATTEAPLTAIQRWFFEQQFPAPHHFNQAVLLEIKRPVTEMLLRRALDAVAVHHDALRFRFRQHDGVWRQEVDRGAASVPLEWIDLTALDHDAQVRAIAERSGGLQAQLNLASGPIMRAAYFDLGSGHAGRLLIVVHHLVIDAVSWRFLIEDVAAALDLVGRQQPIALAPAAESFAHWAVRMDETAQSPEIESELPYWLDMAGRAVAPLPVDFDRGPNDVESSRSLTVVLTAEETQALLTEASSAYHTQANDLLLAAFGSALAEWRGDPSLYLTFEGHGRNASLEDLDVSRTVGWFTTMYPLRLELPALNDWAAVITAVKEQLRAVPRHGTGYGLLRYVNRNAAVADRMRRLPEPDALWLYLGQFDAGADSAAAVSVARESVGPDRDPSGTRTHVLEVTSLVAEGQLRTTFTYSANRHDRATIDHLAVRYKASVLAAIAHCRAVESATFTPSDFPQAGLSQTELDALFSRLAGS